MSVQFSTRTLTRLCVLPADGQDEDELENPAPSFTILPASAEGDHHDVSEAPVERVESVESEDGGSDVLGWAGGVALVRTRTTA